MALRETTAPISDIATRPLSHVLGVEIIGINLGWSIDDAVFKVIKRAFLHHSLVLIRDQKFTPDKHISFSRRFGDLAIHVFDQFLLPGHPEILRVSNRRYKGQVIGLADAGKYWHSDLAYMKKPSLGSVLHALQVPSKGGNTLFANMTRAYDTLTDSMKLRLEGLTAVNRVAEGRRNSADGRIPMSKAQLAKTPEVVHPVIRIHPETGRKSLYISQSHTHHIVGMGPSESRRLLNELLAHATCSGNTYIHKWQPFDVLIWDNRCTMHRVTRYDRRYRRHMHRTTIKGDVPFGPNHQRICESP